MSVRKIVEHLRSRRGVSNTISSFHSFFSVSPHSTRSLQTANHNLQPNKQQDQQDPHSLLKQDPTEICTSLWVKTFSSPKNTSFPNLTGFLSNFDLWLFAYQRSCAHVTGTFPPRNAIHTNVLRDLLSLRNTVIRGRFAWNDKTLQILRSPNDKTFYKPLSKRKFQSFLESNEPCFQDRMVQEVLLMILEPVFEPKFSPKSHAFRPGRNAHTVIRTIRSNFAGYLWFLKGDLSEIFDNVDTDVVMGCVEKGTRDKKVLGLIKSALVGRVSRKVVEGEELKKDKKRKATKKRILKENEPKPDPYWLRTFFSFAPEEAAKIGYEFDFVREADAMERIRKFLYENNKRTPVLVPRVIRDMVTRRVLVMEYMDGIPIMNLGDEIAKRGINPRGKVAAAAKQKILQSLTLAYGQMILKSGFFHADPHPGNILICKGSEVALLDYGQVKDLPEQLRLGYANLVLAIADGDPLRASESYRELGIDTLSKCENEQQEMLKLAQTMFDTKLPPGVLMLHPFSEESSIKKIAVQAFPEELFSVLRTVHLLRGLSVGLGIDYSCAEQWRPIAEEALSQADRLKGKHVKPRGRKRGIVRTLFWRD